MGRCLALVVVSVGLGSTALWYLASRRARVQALASHDPRLAHVRFVDLFLGAAIGDAFSNKLGFKTREWLAEHVRFDKYVAVEDESVSARELGSWSLPTETLLAVAQGLEQRGVAGLNPDTLGEFLQGVAGAHASADLPSVQPGSTTIERLRAGESIERLRDEQQQVDCPDSSLLLGALPIGFLGHDELQELSSVLAKSLQPHRKAHAAILLLARATKYFAVDCGHPESIIRHCMRGEVMEIDEETSQFLTDIDSLGDYYGDERMGVNFSLVCGSKDGLPVLTGDAMRSVGAILYLLKWYRGAPAELLRHAVLFGGETDAVVSASLAIACARDGVASLPFAFIDRLDHIESLEAAALRFKEWLFKQQH